MTIPDSNSQQGGKVWEPHPMDVIRNCLDNSLKRAAELLRSTGHEGDAIDAKRLEYQRELNACSPTPSQEGRSSLSVEGWRPIETAPIQPFDKATWYERKTPRLLLCGGYSWVYVGAYSYTERGKGRWLEESLGHIAKPTHWMPLPNPPEQA